MSAPPSKKKKLNAALAAAIGATTKTSTENLEKPIALALISDEKSAKDLLHKINAHHRPKEVLDFTLKICAEKNDEALVGDAFLSLFRQYFPILGLDSAIKCWESLEIALNQSKSKNEILIAVEFLKKANLLSQGFGKLISSIKTFLPDVIQKLSSENREFDAALLSYSLICLVLAETSYLDQKSPNFWESKVLTKDMKNSLVMALLTILAASQENEDGKSIKSAKKLLEKVELAKEDENIQELLITIFLNHLEYFTTVLPESVISTLLKHSIRQLYDKNQLKTLANRIQTVEIEDLPIHVAICEEFSTDNDESDRIIDFLEPILSIFESKNAKLEVSEFTAQVWVKNEGLRGRCEGILKKLGNFEKLKKKIGKSDKNIEKMLEKLRIEAEEGAREEKYVNYTTEQVIEKLKTAESSSTAISILKGVHTPDVQKGILGDLALFVENIDGGKSLDEIELYSKMIDIYGDTQFESLCVQIVFARLAADNWGVIASLGAEEESEEDVRFEILTSAIDLMDKMIKSAKNSVVKSFSAIYCQIYTQVLKSVQKYIRYIDDFHCFLTISDEKANIRILRRHKLIQDVARIAESIKRNDTYFSMLVASVIGNTVFNGASTILAMSRLHSTASKYSSALLATNLPATERTRYNKFLPIITRASKKIY